MKSLWTAILIIPIGTLSYVACRNANEPSIPVESTAVSAGSGETNPVVQAGDGTPEKGTVDGDAKPSEDPKETPNETPQDLPNGSSPGPSPTNDPANIPANPGDGAPAPAPAPETAPIPAPSPDPVPLPAPTPPGTPAPAPEPAPAPTPVFAADCSQVKKTQAGAKTGLSTIFINPNDAATRRAIDAYCDQDEDGGGWTLFLNYVHKAATNPVLTVKATTLPVKGSDTLGTDESPQTKFWGHAGNAMLKNFTIKEIRFFCKSSKQANIVLNFKTSDPDCIKYATTGQGSCKNIQNSFTKLTGHNASIPALQDFQTSNLGDFAMTNDVFGRTLVGNPDPPDPDWSIRGGGNSQSWECDFGSNDAANDTIHRIFFR